MRTACGTVYTMAPEVCILFFMGIERASTKLHLKILELLYVGTWSRHVSIQEELLISLLLNANVVVVVVQRIIVLHKEHQRCAIATLAQCKPVRGDGGCREIRCVHRSFPLCSVVTFTRISAVPLSLSLYTVVIVGLITAALPIHSLMAVALLLIASVLSCVSVSPTCLMG